MRQTTSIESLERRLADQQAFVTINNALNYFDVLVPSGAVVHWAARVKPDLKRALAVFNGEEMKKLTFSELKSSFPDAYGDAISGLNFIIRSGGKV